MLWLKDSNEKSRHVDSVGKIYDVNRRASYAITEQGKGWQALADFCTVFWNATSTTRE